MRALRLSWALFAFTCLCMATYLVLGAYPDLYLLSGRSVLEGFPFIPFGVLLSAVVGALILGRHPRHRIGWLLAIAGAGGAVNFAAGAYAYRVLATQQFGSATAGHAAAWVAQFF